MRYYFEISGAPSLFWDVYHDNEFGLMPSYRTTPAIFRIIEQFGDMLVLSTRDNYDETDNQWHNLISSANGCPTPLLETLYTTENDAARGIVGPLYEILNLKWSYDVFDAVYRCGKFEFEED